MGISRVPARKRSSCILDGFAHPSSDPSPESRMTHLLESGILHSDVMHVCLHACMTTPTASSEVHRVTHVSISVLSSAPGLLIREGRVAERCVPARPGNGRATAVTHSIASIAAMQVLSGTF
jgi:hypothetical protein